MLDLTDLVAFRLDEQRYALPLMAVERVIRAVDVTPLP
nr:chemotaxis protein CheW [Gammaproteobacteria bacterium]